MTWWRWRVPCRTRTREAMAKRIDTSGYTTFGQITERLDEIVGQVRRKDVPLERSLDLYDEAIALGSKAVDFVDTAPIESSERAGDATQPAEGHDTNA